MISIEDFQKASFYLNSEGHDLAGWIHSYGQPAKNDTRGNFLKNRDVSIQKFIKAETVAGMRMVPEKLPLNILIVENNLSAFKTFEDSHFQASPLWNHLKHATWYLVDKDFRGWENALKEDKNRNCIESKFAIKEIRWKPDGTYTYDETAERKATIKYCEIDLILQDIFLDQKADVPLGYQLTEQYFELIPQAMVFLLTSLDIEYLAATGITHKADRVISKLRMGAVWWYYYEAFVSLCGRMFWQPWCEAPTGDDSTIESRNNLRKFFGCLRRWSLEPEILWHGQNLPEMIDHGHQHISDLWRMTDHIIGKALENSPDLNEKFSTEDRVTLSLGIWLHDIGHRGDEFHVEPMEIRDAHGGISEQLLLSKPEAFGVEWLGNCCPDDCKGKDHVKIRNDIQIPLCPLRKLGLLCRAHQSSAPLWSSKLPSMFNRLKFPSNYCRVGYDSANEELHSPKTLDLWMDINQDLDWGGFDIRCMEDFKDERLIDLICLLRWLDALNVSRARTGSKIHIETHKLFLKERIKWVENKLKEIKGLLETSPVGSKVYINKLGEQLKLLDYKELLEAQDIHRWLHDAVDCISTDWKKMNNGEGDKSGLVIYYDIYLGEPEEEIKNKLEKEIGDISEYGDRPEARFRYWAAYMHEKMIKPEIESQIKNNETKSIVENFFDPVIIQISFRIDGQEYNLWPLDG